MSIFNRDLVDRLIGTELPLSRRTWGPRDVILYHLGVGAGCGPAADLGYLYEPDLVVLPSFAATVAHATGAHVDGIAGLTVDRGSTLHGEQEIVLVGEIPVAADSETTGRVIEIVDLGAAAMIRVETKTRAAGQLLFTTTFGVVVRGEGGFGVRRLAPAREALPDRPPDESLVVTTSRRQAAIYRLLGDSNPLHIDPAYARRRGYGTPILHGLSTYGSVLKALVDESIRRDRSVASFVARFSAPVHPGETLQVDTWHEADDVLVRAMVPARGAMVLSHGRVGTVAR